jgi:MFS family permease
MNAEKQALWSGRAAIFFGVFVPFALGHYVSALLRNINAVMAPSLVASLALNAGQLGLLTSAFFFSVVLTQLPTATALERYGPYKVQVALLLFAAMGVLLFAKGHSFTELLLARAMIGFGVGGTLMTAVRAVSVRIAPEKLPSLFGYLMAVGGVGAASATMPVRQLLQQMDWRELFMLLAGLIVAICLLTWLTRPTATRFAIAPAPHARLPSMRSLLAVWNHPGFRKTISLVLVSHTIFWGVQGLWVGRWLSDVAHFSNASVAYLLYLSMSAVIFGSIGVGILTEWAGRRGIVALDVAAVGVGLFMLVQVAIVCNFAPSLQLLAVLFTLVGTIGGIEYTIVAQSVPRDMAGHAASCLNMLIFMGAFLIQAGFGQIIGLWPPDASGHYPVLAYRVAFGFLLLLQLPCLLLYLRERRPVKCESGTHTLEEDYEIDSLRSPR